MQLTKKNIRKICEFVEIGKANMDKHALQRTTDENLCVFLVNQITKIMSNNKDDDDNKKV